MDPDREKLIYAIEHELCPECCTELDYYSYHERDSTYDEHFCPKCNWRVSISDWDRVADEENLEQGSKVDYGLSFTEDRIFREMSEYLTAEIDADILSQLTGEPPETFLKKWGKL